MSALTLLTILHLLRQSICSEYKANLIIKDPSLDRPRRAGGIDPSSWFPDKLLQENKVRSNFCKQVVNLIMIQIGNWNH